MQYWVAQNQKTEMAFLKIKTATITIFSKSINDNMFQTIKAVLEKVFFLKTK